MDIYIPWNGWEAVRMIGRGGFGTVYEIRKETYGTVEKAAMKVISVPENNERLDDLYGSGLDDESVSTWCSNRIESIVREYSVMSRLKGKTNIVSCEDIDVVPHKNDPGADIYIRMEKLTSLTKLLSLVSKREETLSDEDRETLRKLRPDHKEFTEEDVIKLGKDVSQALEICEKNNIVHRDIKPENILISEDGDYKLGDFGTARKMDHTTAATFAGTERYMAPEVIKGGKTGKDVDTYALGLVMYRLLNRGRLPFYPLTGIPTAEQVEEAQRRRLAGEPFDPPVDGSPELKALVMKACSYDRNDRFASAAEMTEKIEEAEEIRMERIRNDIPDPVCYGSANREPVNNGGSSVGSYSAGADAVEDAWDEDSDKTIGSQPVIHVAAEKIQMVPEEDITVSGPRNDTIAPAAEDTIDEFIIGDVMGAPRTPPQSPPRSYKKRSNKKLLIAAICVVLCLGLLGIIGSGIGIGGGDGETSGGDGGSGSDGNGGNSGSNVSPDATFTSVTQEYAQTKRWTWGDTPYPDSYNPEAEEYYISRVNAHSDEERDEKGHPLTDNDLVFLKYAIADFDGDGLVEWAVCRYDFNQDKENEEHPSVEVDLYYYDGSAYSPYHGDRFQGRDFDPDRVTFYNNMVWIEELDKDGKHYTYVHFLNWFGDEARGELIKHYCPEYGDGLVFINDGSGTIIREEVSYYGGYEWEDTITQVAHEDYEAEILEITKDAEIIHPEFKEYIPE